MSRSLACRYDRALVDDGMMVRAGNLFRRAGLARLARATTAHDNFRITLTHYVRDEDLPQFKRIVRALVERRRPIALEDVYAYYDRESPRRIEGQRLLMTFDDGLLSSFRATQEVLNPLGIKATFFVPTRILDLEDREEMRQFFWNEVYHRRRPIAALRPEEYETMSVEHLRELRRQGHSVLPHTHSHVNLSDIADEESVERELRAPKARLEDALQSSAPGFAFPVGTERVVSAFAYQNVRRIYSFCFSGLIGINTATTDPFFLYRDCVHPFYSVEHVRNIADASYDLFYRLKMRRLKRRSNSAAPA
jgi:peptidoglycan/xylan/chitin deacetylase (PgdA/CDA1 family)